MTKFQWFTTDGRMIDYDFLKRQALELCNMLGIKLGHLYQERVYEDYTTTAWFSKKEVTKKRLVKIKYSISVEGVVDSEDTVPYVLDAWCKGYNSIRGW